MSVTLNGTSGLVFSDGTIQGTAAGMPFRNRIINGDMRIAQRGTSFAVTNNGIPAYPTDRFRFITTIGAYTVSRSTNAPVGFGYSANLLVTTGAAATTIQETYFEQLIEGQNLSDLAYGTSSAMATTLSFWVRSSVTGTYGLWILQDGASRSISATYTVNTANTWEYKTITIPGDVSGSIPNTTDAGLRIRFYLDTGPNSRGTISTSWGSSSASARISTSHVAFSATTNNTISFTGVQLEKAAAATDFEFRPYPTELALCQRYFEKTYGQSITPGTASTVGMRFLSAAFGAGNYYSAGSFVVPKRAAPSMAFYDGAGNASKASYTAGSWYNNTLSATAVASNETGYEMYTAGQSGYASQFCHYVANAEL